MKEAMNIKKLSFYGPVTALAFCNAEKLLAGCGTSLAMYNWQTGKLITEINLFKRSKIQGIAVGAEFILVWGAYSFAFIAKVQLLDGHKVKEYVMEDWLMAGHCQGDHAYLVTAHNLLLRINLNRKSLEKVVAKSVECILYSAEVFSDDTDVIIAAGTVFGEIEIWSVYDTKKAIKLRGHEGSIFNVCFSKDGSKLISCSDDRSIRVWDLETQQCLAVGWGHLSRIWQLEYLSDDCIISTGEDNTTRVWAYDNGTLECQQVWEGHSGRNIWSLAVCKVDEDIVATGGADGAIRLWDVSEKPSQSKLRETISFNSICDNVNTQCGQIKQYITTNNTSCAFSTALGHIILLDEIKSIWSIVYSNSDLAGYSILRGWKDKPYICAGDRNGVVYVIHTDGSAKCETIRAPTSITSKVLDMITINNDGSLYLLVQYGSADIPWSLFVFKESIMEPEFTLALTPPATFPISSAIVNANGKHIIIGSRFGAVALYDTVPQSEPKNAMKCWRRIISDDTITSLTMTYSVESTSDILVTSRNGSYSVCSISIDSEGEADLTKLSLNRLAKGGIEGAAYLNTELIAWGFRNNYFFVWNETLQYEMFSEVCGGAHRHWDFTIVSANAFEFLYTKSTSICWIKAQNATTKLLNRTPQNGSHGREIRTISTSNFDENANEFLLATGAEDSCIRVGKVTSGTLTNLCVLRWHVSGIQEVKWSANGCYLFSSAAREEFTVWKVTTRGHNVYLYPLASAPIQSAMPDLRVMDFVAQEFEKDGQLYYFLVTVYSDSTIKIWSFNTTTAEFCLVSSGRYKTCCIFKTGCVYYKSTEKFYFLIGSSDGFITGWDLTALFESVSTTAQKNLKFPSPVWSIPVHQSSVRSFCILNSSSTSDLGKTLIITGGDDNSICVSDFVGGSFDLVRRLSSIPSAHASTVTSISELADGVVMSTAVDQRVRIWKASKTGSDNLSLIDEHYTSVSDTGCSAVHSGHGQKTLLIGGNGLAIWSC
ncbi:WD40-repeat-containing domain protein [Lipomyces arxii]|uniref:WD40-repeat-containing domain protein n=1 Tax=Lipomyces arxii TaxID=56418 RepID=UPI0034CFE523